MTNAKIISVNTPKGVTLSIQLPNSSTPVEFSLTDKQMAIFVRNSINYLNFIHVPKR